MSPQVLRRFSLITHCLPIGQPHIVQHAANNSYHRHICSSRSCRQHCDRHIIHLCIHYIARQLKIEHQTNNSRIHQFKIEHTIHHLRIHYVAHQIITEKYLWGFRVLVNLKGSNSGRYWPEDKHASTTGL